MLWFTAALTNSLQRDLIKVQSYRKSISAFRYVLMISAYIIGIFSFSDYIRTVFNFHLFGFVRESPFITHINFFLFQFFSFRRIRSTPFLFSDSFRTPFFLFAINMMTGIEEKQKSGLKSRSFKLKSPVFLCAISMMTETKEKQKSRRKQSLSEAENVMFLSVQFLYSIFKR